MDELREEEQQSIYKPFLGVAVLVALFLVWYVGYYFINLQAQNSAQVAKELRMQYERIDAVNKREIRQKTSVDLNNPAGVEVTTESAGSVRKVR